jgi:diguanylate cyclase (GGDEF)-like protein/PAS domain S-box-containing protein
MPPPIRILLVEDRDSDAELLTSELRAQGLVCEVERVETAEAMAATLRTFRPDAVLSDYSLPRFNGMAAIALARECDPTLPVIIVTGSLNELTAVECMKAGAADYVLKDHLVRLGGALEAALEGRRHRLASREAEARYRGLFNSVPVGLFRASLDGQFLEANAAVVRLLGCPDRETLLRTPPQRFYGDGPSRNAWLDRLECEEVLQGVELQLQRLDGVPIRVRMNARAFRDASGHIVVAEGALEDITAEKRAEQERERAVEALRQGEARLRMVTEQIPAVVWATDPDLRFTFAAGSGLRQLGLLPGQVVGRGIDQVFGDQESAPAAISAHKRALLGESVSYEHEWKSRFFATRVEPLLGGDGHTTGTIGFALDVSEKRKAEETIRHQAYHDGLTGLPNRLLFADRFAQTLDHARRGHQSLAMLFLDLDRFKNINDTLGHAVGDRLLQAVTGRLSASVRAGDTVARFGGDEFMVLLSGIDGAEDAARAADKILRLIRPSFHLDGHELHVTTSIGIAVYPEDGHDIGALIKNADTALYRAKERGRNTYQLYTPAMNATAFEQLALENDLRRALERSEFTIHYQPEVALASGRIVGAEGLLRWERGGRLLPAPEFISLAEDAGLIIPLEEWAIETACRQGRLWQANGYAPLRVAVNISLHHFEDRNLPRAIERALANAGLDPELLELELTESALMRNSEGARAALAELKSMGIRISIDDFGTGYSSLSYLKRLPVDALKIDRSFISDVTTDANDAAIVRAVVTLAHSLGIEVVAEGVETAEQLELLRAEGCDIVQGFLLSCPLPPEEFGQLFEAPGDRIRVK